MAMQGMQLHLNHLGENIFSSHTWVTENDTSASTGHGGKNIISTGKVHDLRGCQGFEIQYTS